MTKEKLSVQKHSLSILFGDSSIVGKESRKQTAKRQLVKCMEFVIKLSAAVKDGVVVNGREDLKG